MLELLAQGASNRLVARKMGYREGTMRVYLHNLYRKLGVSNKTEAVIWYLARDRMKDAPVKAAASSAESRQPGAGDPVGDMALDEDLYTTLGVMSWFVGPYGRVWEVGVRMNGTELDAAALARRARARQLWRALLKGDFAHGKRVFDQDQGEALITESPSDAVLLAGLLVIGGYASAAQQFVARLGSRRKGVPGISSREAALLDALPGAMDARDEQSLADLSRISTDRATPAVLRQVAVASLFHAHRARRDFARARKAANAMWAEAEAAKQHLHAMGERTLGHEPARAAVGRAVETEPARRTKVAVAR